MNRATVEQFLKRGLVENDDIVILTKGDLMGTCGGTNAMKIASVEQILAAVPDDWQSHIPDRT